MQRKWLSKIGLAAVAVGVLLVAAGESQAQRRGRGDGTQMAPPFMGSPNSPSIGLSGGYGYRYEPSYYFYQPEMAVADSEVRLSVRVPAEATVWINGAKTTQTGARREFASSDLTPGRNYTYEVRAKWLANGQEVERTMPVTVRGGEWRSVDFWSR